MRLLILLTCSFWLCGFAGNNRRVKPDEIQVSKIECGSYEITYHKRVLGYAVPPLSMKFPKENFMKEAIANFESAIAATQMNLYRKQFRIYHFSGDNQKDTIMEVLILSKIQADTVTNWRCRYLPLDKYGLKHYHKQNKAPGFKTLTYNCTENRLDCQR